MKGAHAKAQLWEDTDMLKRFLILLPAVLALCLAAGPREGVKRACIRDGVTHIAAHAFAYCSNLEYVEMADSVTIIGEYAFEDCTSLTDVR